MKQTNTTLTEKMGNYDKISISGIPVLVSSLDTKKILAYSWYIDRSKVNSHNLFYFQGNILNSETNRKKSISLHRYIMNQFTYDKKMVVDHINGDTLDNRQENLRLVTISENVKNKRTHIINRIHLLEDYNISMQEYKKETFIEHMNINRINYTVNKGYIITTLQYNDITYKISTLFTPYHSTRNKFGYPCISYDTQHKKIMVFNKETKKKIYSGNLLEVYKIAYDIYKIPYTIEII